MTSTQVITPDRVGAGGDARLRAAFLVSSTGDWIYRLAVPLLVLRITGSALSTAFSYALEFVPYVLLGPLAGVVADRADRRRTLIGCDALSTVLAAVIAVLAAAPDPPIGLVYLSVFLLACLRPVYFPAFQGLLVDIVEDGRLARVNSWTQTVDSGLGMLGPLAGTALVVATGTATAATVNSVSFAVSALLVVGVGYHRPAGSDPAGPGGDPRSGRAAAALRGVLRDLADGFHIIAARRSMTWGIGLMALSNLAVFLVQGNLFYLLLHVQGQSKLVVGLVFSAQGLGAVVGAVLAPRLLGRWRTGQLLVVSMGLSAACICVVAAIPRWGALLPAWAALGVATSVTVVAWFTARQRIIPPGAAGRVASVSRAVAYTTIPIGSVLGAWLLAGGSARTLFAGAAVTQMAVFVGTLLSPFSRIDRDIPA